MSTRASLIRAKTMLPKIFLTAWALFPALSHLTAGAEPGTMQVRLIAFPKAEQAGPLQLVVAEGRTIEVEVPSHEISRTYTVPSQEHWVLGESSESGDGEFRALGEAVALSARKQLLVVIRKGEGDEAELEVHPYACDGPGFQTGRFLFLNNTGVHIEGSLGEADFTLEPHARVVVGPAEKDAAARRAHVIFREQDSPRPFFSSTWPLSAKARSLVFFHLDAESGGLRFHAVRDFLD